MVIQKRFAGLISIAKKPKNSMDEKIEFVRNILRTSHVSSLSDNATEPSTFLDATVEHPELMETGIQLLRNGMVAVLMVAGGMSTRMSNTGLRGNLPIGPVTGRSIFRLQGEKVAAIKRRYSPQMPWLVMTSSAVHDETIQSFRKAGFFGVAQDDVWFFQQASLPVFDTNQNPVQLTNGTYLESPIGHGGMLDAINTSGLLHRLRKQGIEYLFYFQFPNVLERVCDPVMLGYHHMSGFDVTTKAISKYRPAEKMGSIVEVKGLLRIVEYHFLRDVPLDSWWHKVPANIGTHIWNVSLIEKCIKEGIQLPYHVVPHHGAINAPAPLQKVEQFIFDLLVHASATGLVIVARDEEYAPVKSMTGTDSLESGRKALSRLYCNWLDQAGAILLVPEERNCRVEISPLYALYADDLRKKLPLGFKYGDGLVLQ